MNKKWNKNQLQNDILFEIYSLDESEVEVEKT